MKLWYHHKTHRIERHHAQCVQFFRHIHARYLGCDGGTTAPSHQDRRDQRPHLAYHGYGQQVGNKDVRPVDAQLHRSLEGQDKADDERHQSDDRHGVEAQNEALLDY